MNILGVSCYHHDSAAASIKDNRIVGASHEERFSRNKYDNNFPIHTIDWLKNAYDDFDHAVFYEETTYKRFKRDIKKVRNEFELRSRAYRFYLLQRKGP